MHGLCSRICGQDRVGGYPLPRSFLIKSLVDFAAGFDQELSLCPVRTLREYLNWASYFVNCPLRLFVSPCALSGVISKNGILYLFREVIVESTNCSEEVSTLGLIAFVVLLPPLPYLRTGPFQVFLMQFLGCQTLFQCFPIGLSRNSFFATFCSCWGADWVGLTSS